MKPPLLILDLDETLVYATETPLDHAPDFNVGPYNVYLRPHTMPFLKQVRQWYRLAVWTSSSEGYANGVVDNLIPDRIAIEFLWARERCTHRFDPELLEYGYTKDLRKLKRRLREPLERIIILDDSPEKHRQNYGNLVRVRPFVGDRTDTELLQVLPYLKHLHTHDNFRAIEKRTWREHPATLRIQSPQTPPTP